MKPFLIFILILQKGAHASPTLASLGQLVADEHNAKRQLHCDTPPLTFSLEISEVAQKIADKKVWAHSDRSERNNYGENLAWNTEDSIEEAIKSGIDQFYDEISVYNWQSPSSAGTDGTTAGHFTQVVWTTSTKIGIGYTRFVMNGMEGWLMVFHYDPAGNFIGQYGDHVKPLKTVDNCGVDTESGTESSDDTESVDELASNQVNVCDLAPEDIKPADHISVYCTADLIEVRMAECLIEKFEFTISDLFINGPNKVHNFEDLQTSEENNCQGAFADDGNLKHVFRITQSLSDCKTVVSETAPGITTYENAIQGSKVIDNGRIKYHLDLFVPFKCHHTNAWESSIINEVGYLGLWLSHKYKC